MKRPEERSPAGEKSWRTMQKKHGRQYYRDCGKAGGAEVKRLVQRGLEAEARDAARSHQSPNAGPEVQGELLG